MQLSFGSSSGRENHGRNCQTNSPRRIASVSRWLIVLSGLFCVGCGSSLEKGKVSGVITRGDEPLDSVMVYFMPDPDAGTEGSASWAITDDSGRYVLEYQGKEGGEGAVIGRHRVTFEDLVPENFRGQGEPPKPRVSPQLMNPATTPFRYEVTSGEQTIDIDISDPPAASNS